jgi:mycothiol system anti-sigma-R factor
MAEGDCNDSLAELYTFLDGELTDDKRMEIRQHLDDCSPCLERFDFQAELKAVISQKCREEVPQELRDRIARSLGIEADSGA